MIKNEDNLFNGTEGGNDTNDKVFCLSMSEILKCYDFNSWYDEENQWYSKSGHPYYGFGYSEQLIILGTKYVGGNSSITEELYRDGDEFMFGLIQEGYSESCIGKNGVSSGWWLRSPGPINTCTCYVFYYGEATADTGCFVDNPGGVRPALYIKKL